MDHGVEAFFTVHGRITTGLLAILGALQIYRWVARRKLTLSYGLVWLAISFALLAIVVFPDLLLWMGWLAGSRQPDGALRLAGFVFVAGVLLYLSLKVSALEARLEALVQAIALRGLEATPPAGTSVVGEQHAGTDTGPVASR